EYKTQIKQLLTENTSLGSEVTKLQKELELIQNQQPDGGQMVSLQEELKRLQEELQEAHTQRKRMEEEHGSEKLSLTQLDQERERYQNLVKEFSRLEQRYDNLKEEMSLSKEMGVEKAAMDISVFLKLQKRVRELETENKRLQVNLDKMEELAKRKRQELELENKKLKNDLNELRKTIAERASQDSSSNEVQDSYNLLLSQLKAASEELDARKEEVLILRTQIVSNAQLQEKSERIVSLMHSGSLTDLIWFLKPLTVFLMVLLEQHVALHRPHSALSSCVCLCCPLLLDTSNLQDWCLLNEDGELGLAYQGLKQVARSLCAPC
ncbi:hypothetical protein XENOCAPTIV_008351, partial [Xenoophorus captivus]